MRVIQIFAAAAIALVSTFSFADTGAEQAIRKSLETLQLDVPVESISASKAKCSATTTTTTNTACTPTR